MRQSLKRIMSQYDSAANAKELDSLTRKIMKQVNWGEHRLCHYPHCAIVDIFTILFNSLLDLSSHDEKKVTKTCQKLAIEILLTTEDWRKKLVTKP